MENIDFGIKDLLEICEDLINTYKVSNEYSLKQSIKSVLGKYNISSIEANSILFKMKKFFEHNEDSLVVDLLMNYLEKNEIKRRKGHLMNISFFERIMKELDIIETVFKCQFIEIPRTISSNRKEPCHLGWRIDIRSDEEIFNLKDFVDYYANRYETARDKVLIKHELNDILNKAISINNLYIKNLSENSDLRIKFRNDKAKVGLTHYRKHSGYVILNNLIVNHIEFGFENRWIKKQPFNYTVFNNDLNKFCKEVINFIKKFELSGSKTDFKFENEVKNSNSKVTFKSLVSLFEYTSKYKKVMPILVEKQKIDIGNYFWIDFNNGHKKELASLIKHFQIKGYYKDNKKPTDNEVKLICKNTFGIDVSISTIQHSKPTDFNFDYIPYASTLDIKD